MDWTATPARLSTADAGFEAAFRERLHWSAETDAQVEQRVAEILADVQQRGDAAVLAYTNRFDALAATALAQQYDTNYAAKNPAGMAALYASDGVLVAPSGSIVRGRQAQREAEHAHLPPGGADAEPVRRVVALDRRRVVVLGGRPSFGQEHGLASRHVTGDLQEPLGVLHRLVVIRERHARGPGLRSPCHAA